MFDLSLGRVVDPLRSVDGELESPPPADLAFLEGQIDVLRDRVMTLQAPVYTLQAQCSDTPARALHIA